MKGERKLVADMVSRAFLGAIDMKEYPANGSFERSQTDVFFNKRLENPKRRPLFITWLATNHLFKIIPEETIDYYKDAPDWWIGGMQRYVVHTLYLAIDHEEENHVYIFYHLLNDAKCLRLLGRIEVGLHISRLVHRAFRKFMRYHV
jgi:hypothetical protein